MNLSSSCSYCLEIPQNKRKLCDLIEKYPNILRLTTFPNTQDEIRFLREHDEQIHLNSTGKAYIRDVLWSETGEIMGITGLELENDSQTAVGFWKILLFEPLATYDICEEILQEYFEVARCLLVNQIHVKIPHKFKTISNVLLNNGFISGEETEEIKSYTWDISDRLSDSHVSPLCDADSREICDEDILCRGCGQYFLFSAEEHSVYLEKEFVPPKRCPKCRLIKKIALQSLAVTHFQGSDNQDESKYNQTLQNICYSWRYKGQCRYGSECRYIHEDLSSIATLYNIDKKSTKLSDENLYHYCSDATDSAQSSVDSQDTPRNLISTHDLEPKLQKANLQHRNVKDMRQTTIDPMENLPQYQFLDYPQFIPQMMYQYPYSPLYPQYVPHIIGYDQFYQPPVVAFLPHGYAQIPAVPIPDPQQTLGVPKHSQDNS